jgi:hypothetical protein
MSALGARAKYGCPAAAEGDPNTNFFRSLHDKIGQHAAYANRGEKSATPPNTIASHIGDRRFASDRSMRAVIV